jgi:hypothetical protein
MSFLSKALLPALFSLSTLACATAQAEVPTTSSKVVVQEPAAVNADTLRQELAQRRAIHLDQLLAYADAGEFPANKVANGPLNVFIDDEGHVCAAANLINLDGYGALVKKTARTDNYIVLAQVTKGPLFDWMLTSGFTQEEIAQIQEPYMPTAEIGPQENPQIATSVAPHFAAPPITADEERVRVQKVLRAVHKLLSANSQKSLHLAAQRLENHPKLSAAMLAQPRTLAAR